MIRLMLTAACLSAAMASSALALDCKTATGQSDMNICADQDFKAADTALNATYAQVVKRLPNAAAADAKSLLVAAQRDWVAFRDAECAFRTSDSEGGSMHPMDVQGCRQQLTEERTAALKRYLSCKPEDSDCPTGSAN